MGWLDGRMVGWWDGGMVGLDGIGKLCDKKFVCLFLVHNITVRDIIYLFIYLFIYSFENVL